MIKVSELLLILTAGIAFGAWPLITRGSKLHYLPAGLALQAGTLLVFTFFILIMHNKLDLGGAFDLSSAKKFAILALVAGLVNGAGQLAMQNLIHSGTIEISRFATIILTVQAVIYTFGGCLIYHEPITINKVAGLITAATTVWLLGR